MTRPTHLYTSSDVAKVRKQIYDEQNGHDALTGLPLTLKDAVTDHNHSTQYVRGILHRQSNAVLGKIENLWKRYLSYWCSGTLPDFLRQAADYLEKKDDMRFIHPGFLKKLQTMYNSLNESSKKEVLQSMNQHQGTNATERKALFRKALMTRKFTCEGVKNLINKQKGTYNG